MNGDLRAEVAVVGAGGCGTVVALTAAALGGVDVVLLEKDASVPTNTDMSTGVIAAAGTRLQRAAGIPDTPEVYAADITRKNGGTSDPALTLALCQRSADVIHWFIDELGIPLELETEITRFDHTYLRMHAHPMRSGVPIMQVLRERVGALPGVRYLDRTPGRGLLSDAAGAVVGVLAGPDGAVRRIAAQRVVLATGGFGANRELLAAHISDMAQAPYFGAPSNTGEGIVWGLEAGAALAHMAGYQGLGYVVPDHNTRLHPGAITGGGIIVNLAARRFEREDLGYSEWGRVLHGQPGGVGVAVWDEETHRAVAWTAQMVESQQAGALARCGTVGEVAQRFGLDAATLAETLAAYNRAVAEGRDPLGRRKLPRQLVPPYYAARVCGALAHTQGGLKIDLHGRVLRPDGRPVPNLYAGGGTAAAISGDTPEGYLSGNGFLTTFVLGRIIGEHVVAALRRAM